MPQAVKELTFDTSKAGTCCTAIKVKLTGETITHVEFVKGCPGNLRAIPALIRGRNAQEVIQILNGNLCDGKTTSCADQLAKALRATLQTA